MLLYPACEELPIIWACSTRRRVRPVWKENKDWTFGRRIFFQQFKAAVFKCCSIRMTGQKEIFKDRWRYWMLPWFIWNVVKLFHGIHNVNLTFRTVETFSENALSMRFRFPVSISIRSAGNEFIQRCRYISSRVSAKGGWAIVDQRYELHQPLNIQQWRQELLRKWQ